MTLGKDQLFFVTSTMQKQVIFDLKMLNVFFIHNIRRWAGHVQTQTEDIFCLTCSCDCSAFAAFSDLALYK